MRVPHAWHAHLQTRSLDLCGAEAAVDDEADRGDERLPAVDDDEG